MPTNTLEKSTEMLYMEEAYREAVLAGECDEVPVGAVIVREGEIIARGRNRREETGIATHHAEILAIEEACKKTGNWYLVDCDLYVTLEPCAMCMGAIVNSRVRRVIFGAYDHRFGCCGSIYNLAEGKFNHTPKVTGGVMQEKCSSILTEFFKKKRK